MTLEEHRVVTEPADTRNLNRWAEYRIWPGHVERREVTVTPWVEVSRTDCFCCSCPPGSTAQEAYHGTDPHCRLHGWDGRRPCRQHRTVAEAGMHNTDLASVQARREINERQS